MAVSDASMLAPEEIFSGKGNIKDESELTQEDRKRRRATKKRKFKGKEMNKQIEQTLGKSTESDGIIHSQSMYLFF